MATDVLQPGEIVAVCPRQRPIEERKTSVLVKTPTLRVMRIELPAGEELKEHKAPGDITVHCIAGKVNFTVHGSTQELSAGSLLYLAAEELHAVEAIEPSALLVTVAIQG
ncbi:MAG: cupin domain-containing protein [Aureliella sp.]